MSDVVASPKLEEPVAAEIPAYNPNHVPHEDEFSSEGGIFVVRLEIHRSLQIIILRKYLHINIVYYYY